MIRDASPAETMALNTAAEILHKAGLKRVILLGWPGPRCEGVVLSADATTVGSDALAAAETFMELAAGMSWKLDWKLDGTPVEASRVLWVLMGTVAQKLELSTDDLKKGFDLTAKGLRELIQDNKK